MKVLNLYAGIGGNRKLWKNVEVTAVEKNESIAKIYSENYPNDNVFVGDAQKFLVNHYQEYDFIWASPPCQTHSSLRRVCAINGAYPPKLPDLSLYSLILFLKHYANCKWIVENVEPYYKPLISPTVILDRHFIWSNFPIPNKLFSKKEKPIRYTGRTDTRFGFCLHEKKLTHRKDQILRNLVNPEIGKFVFDCAFKFQQKMIVSPKQTEDLVSSMWRNPDEVSKLR